MLSVLAKRHRLFIPHPLRKGFIGSNQPVRFNAKLNRPQFVDDFVSSIWLLSDLRVQPNQCVTQLGLNENVS